MSDTQLETYHRNFDSKMHTKISEIFDLLQGTGRHHFSGLGFIDLFDLVI